MLMICDSKMVVVQGYNRLEIIKYLRKCHFTFVFKEANDFVRRAKKKIPIGHISNKYTHNGQKFYVKSKDGGSYWIGFLKYRKATKREEFLYYIHEIDNINDLEEV